jgi:hypothetical protein
VGYCDSTCYSTKAENNERTKGIAAVKFYVVINIDLLRSVKQVSAAVAETLLHAK